MAKIGHPGSRHPYPVRRINPTTRHRSKNVSWCPDDDAITRECLENWPIPVNVEKLMNMGGPSLVSSTGRVLLRDFLRWAKKNKVGVDESDRFFEFTPYGIAIRWFKDLNLQRVGKDHQRLERMTYGDDKIKD